MITPLGGAVCVPMAVRRSDSTTTMRVKEVIITMIDGASARTVMSAINWSARSVTPSPSPRSSVIDCARPGWAMATRRMPASKPASAVRT